MAGMRNLCRAPPGVMQASIVNGLNGRHSERHSGYQVSTTRRCHAAPCSGRDLRSRSTRHKVGLCTLRCEVPRLMRQLDVVPSWGGPWALIAELILRSASS
jgi:hypothetical protein